MSDVSRDVAEGLMRTGLAPGIVETEFGECVVAKSLHGVNVVFTLTFTLVKEKWAVINGVVVKAVYKEPDWLTGQEEVKKVKERGTVINGPEQKKEVLVPDEVQPPKRKEPKQEVKPKPKGGDTMAAVEGRIKKALSKAERVVGTAAGSKPKRVQERRKPTGKVVKAMTKKGHPTKVTVPIPTKKPTPKLPTTSANPKWRTQLDWKGKKEQVDLNLFPVRITCKDCGDTRYVDRKNAGNISHPVVRCKPCSTKEKDRTRNARAKVRRAEQAEARAKDLRAAERAKKQAQRKK